MLKCYRCECKSHAVYECLKEDFIVYTCSTHVINETSSLPIEYNAVHEAQLDSYRQMITRKQRLLKVILSSTTKLNNRPLSSVKPQNPSNQFLMTGLISLRSAAGQNQNRNQAHIYKLSIKALQKYPLPIIHPEQALDLQGLGPSSLPALHKMFRKSGIFYKNLKKEAEKVKFDKNSETENEELKALVKLVVDQRETRGNELVEMFEKVGVQVVVKTLPLGDYLFIVEYGEVSYVIDMIVERKSASDLNSSNFSNHLQDQIRRLKTSSFSLKFLLIEGKSNFKIVSQVSIRHQINIVNVLNTGKMVEFLKQFYEYFKLIYSETGAKTIEKLEKLEKFDEFQKKHSAGETITQIFYRQILEFPGINSKKLSLFISLYPTLIDFLKSYQENKSLVRQNLSWCGIGSSLESSIFEFFGMRK